MLQGSLVKKVLLQVLSAGAYLALVVILYWRWLWDAGAVAIIVGLLFFLKIVVSPGAISIAHLSRSDPESNIRSPTVELLKTLSFLAVGLGAWIDLAKAMQIGLVPPYLPAAVIHLMLVCIFAICIASCFVRYTAALSNRPRR
jgi:hypothetical protein